MLRQPVVISLMLMASNPLLSSEALAPPTNVHVSPRAATAQYYGYVVIEYDHTTRLRPAVLYVSQIIPYCAWVGFDPIRDLEKDAATEAGLLEGQGQLQRPADYTRRVNFDGANSTRDGAVRSREGWVRRGARVYESGLDARYYPADKCR